MVSRGEAAIGVICSAWAAAFLADQGAQVAFAAAFGLVVLGCRRHPLAAALTAAVTTSAMLASGVPKESPATLAAVFVAAYSLGRYAPAARGMLAIVLLALAMTTVGSPALIDVVFVTVVLSGAWLFGRLVRERARRARRSEALAEGLAARDPVALAAVVVASERARLAGDALAIVRRAVEGMQRDAAGAELDLDPEKLMAVQRGGQASVVELRRLLGLLRSADASGGGAADEGDRARRLRAVDLAVIGVLAALTSIDLFVLGSTSAIAAVALTFLVAASAVASRLDSPIGSLLAAGVTLVALATDNPLVYGFGSAAAAGLLGWAAAVDGRRRAIGALIAAAAVAVIAVAVDAPGNEAIMLGIFALGVLAGHAARGQISRRSAADSTAARVRGEHEAIAERAVRAERLRLARELHDVASHAVGVMVLQSGAALANRERDPLSARASVRAVQTAGREAMTELEALFELLDAGVIGSRLPAGYDHDHDIGRALEALIDRMRGGGLEISLASPERITDDPVVAAAAFRVVQEALTNAARHAPGTSVHVVLTDADGWLGVSVRDTGPAGRPPSAGGASAGFGLVGLAERVRALGGQVAMGPVPDGGFAVTARLPSRHVAELQS